MKSSLSTSKNTESEKKDKEPEVAEEIKDTDKSNSDETPGEETENIPEESTMELVAFVCSRVDVTRQPYVIAGMRSHLGEGNTQNKTIGEWEEIFNKLYTGV